MGQEIKNNNFDQIIKRRKKEMIFSRNIVKKGTSRFPVIVLDHATNDGW